MLVLCVPFYCAKENTHVNHFYCRDTSSFNNRLAARGVVISRAAIFSKTMATTLLWCGVWAPVHPHTYVFALSKFLLLPHWGSVALVVWLAGRWMVVSK